MGRKKQENVKNNVFLVRVNNDNTLSFIEELLETGLFFSKNELLNKCLDFGALELSKKHLKNRRFKSLTNEPSNENTNKDIPRSVKQIEQTVDDLFIMTGIIEHLLTTLFNTKAEELAGEDVSKFDMLSGRLSDLPEGLQEVKDEIYNRHSKRS